MYRPTTLSLFVECCPHALDLYEAGVEVDPDLFALGTAAHEVLHALGEGRDPAAVVDRLVSTGRTGDDATPPLPPSSVYAGRDLAFRFVERHPLPSVEDGASFEHRFAFDRSWSPTEWDLAWFRTRVDVVISTDEGEDEWSHRVVIVRDYKSAWNVDDDFFDDGVPLQQRAQAVAAWLAFPEASEVRVELASLRRRSIVSRSIMLDEDGIATLTAWKDDLSRIMEAASVKPRTPAPGARCHGCGFVRKCGPARAFLDGEEGDVVRRYVAARSLADSLEALARGALAKGEAVVVDGVTVGFVEGSTSEARPGAALSAFRLFAKKIGFSPDADTESAIHAFFDSAEPSKTWFEAVAGKLFVPRKEAKERAAWISEVIETSISPRWGVKKPKA